MTVGYHRGLFYWFLLLVPTLAVGGGALWLLRREQARLDEQTRAAAESNRAALEARAKLIAENVELLIGDVENGLMATLLEAPVTFAEQDPFFEEWERTNPLVGDTFRIRPGGEVLTKSPALEAATWLSSGTPWSAGMRTQVVELEDEKRARNEVSANVAQVLNTRKDVQEFANQKFNSPKKSAAQEQERTGWTPLRDQSRLWLIGWRKLPSGGVIGVTINLAEITGRFGELLPKTGEYANAIAVRESMDVVGRHDLGSTAFFGRNQSRAAAVKVPISSAVLPGWEVAAIIPDLGIYSSGGSFFLVGSLLVGGAVLAILAGGSLLLWQARRSEAEAAQKTSFVANVSHEFKTPLTTIRLYAELLEQGRVRDAAQGADYLHTIGRETQRLARLVNNALDFSRLEQGRKKYACEALDLTVEIARLLDTHAPRLAEAGLTLRRVIPAVPVRLVTDRDAIEQIVLNLLDNACKYAAEGGEVTLTLAARAGGGAEVRVADRGPGVPLEHRERIFEKFHRVDDALTAEKSGAGLGLSIARQLARGLDGELRYASRAGSGAEFILELPGTAEDSRTI